MQGCGFLVASYAKTIVGIAGRPLSSRPTLAPAPFRASCQRELVRRPGPALSRSRSGPGRRAPTAAGRLVQAARAGSAKVSYAVTACARSLLVTWMLRGLAASRTGMVKVSTPAA